MKPHAQSILLLTGAIATASFSARPADAPAPPNLLVIHTDEHNFRTLGCYRALLPKEQGFIWGEGVAVDTPNLDWLAQHGALCDRFYAASPVCTPSRASFVTGRYPQNTGAHVNDVPMRGDMVTFAEVLRRKGYATGYAGKWHLEGTGKPQFGPPRKFGFEDNRYMFNRGHWKQLEDTPNGPRVKAVNAQGQPNYSVAGADAKSFTTDFLADKTVDFIKAHQDKPFCYLVSLPDPHGPNSVRPPYDTMFDHLKFQQPHSAVEKGEDLPSCASVLPDKFNARQMSLYFGMVKCVDDNVGKILAALRSAGLLEKTIVVFTSDHGDMCGEHGRHNKGIPLEASAKVPFVIYAPGKIKPGVVIREALATVDFKPTILGLMGVASEGGDEGRDASALFLNGKAPPGWKDVTISRHASGTLLMAASSRYKLIVSTDSDPCLFDLGQDAFEMRNIFRLPSSRETVRELARALLDYSRKCNEPFAAQPAMQADLVWAAEGTGSYAPPKRDSARRDKAKKGVRKAGKKRTAGEDEE